MNITYTYTIAKVDMEARCMEIVYSSDGRQTMHIGGRLPFEGESLDAVVAMYAPIAHWREQEMAILPVDEGTSGQITTALFVSPSEPENIGAENSGGIPVTEV
jgi:hypothetical protein